MSVADIYGGGYDEMDLPGNLLASSFGKLTDKTNSEISQTITGGDIARSLITMVAANVLVFSASIAQ
jgi:pantothenate kinase